MLAVMLKPGADPENLYVPGKPFFFPVELLVFLNFPYFEEVISGNLELSIGLKHRLTEVQFRPWSSVRGKMTRSDTCIED